jgi:hypothetical protein
LPIPVLPSAAVPWTAQERTRTATRSSCPIDGCSAINHLGGASIYGFKCGIYMIYMATLSSIEDSVLILP